MSGAVSDPCTPDKAVPSGRTPDDQLARRSRRAVLLAVPQAAVRPRRRRLVARSGRRPRRRVAPRAHPHVLGRAADVSAERAAVRAASQRLAGMQRYGAFLWSGDVYSTWETLKTHVPVAVNTGLSGIPYWGTDIGGFVPTAEYTGELHVRWFQFGTFCPSFRAHGRNWHLRLPWGWNTGQDPAVSKLRGYTGGAGGSRSGRAEQPARRADRPEVPRAALSAAAVHLHHRARVHRDGPADDARAVAASRRRSAGGGARRSVPVGPRHPGRAGRREGRDVAGAVSAARRLVRLLDRGARRGRPRDRSRRSISRRCRCTCAPARSFRWGR